MLLVSIFLFTIAWTNVLVSSQPPLPNKIDDEGYPLGYLSDCPGSTKPVVVTRKGLRHLTFAVQGDGGPLLAQKTKYNYFQMKALAKKLDFKKKTFLFVGGYLDSPLFSMSVASLFGDLYKRKGYNVLLLDTNPFTSTYYPIAVRKIHQAAIHAAEMLSNLTQYGFNPKTTEVLSISLGCHTMGFIGKHYYKMTGKKLGRLTGMDPAGPCFRNVPPEGRLDKGDGEYVDVIHTNVDGLGMAPRMGHIDYYVNGGEFQPMEFDIWMACFDFCSHIRAGFIWWSMLDDANTNCFIAMKCDSIQQARNRTCYDRVPRETTTLTLKADRSVEGIYYLATQNNPPYCLGKNGLKRKHDFFTAKMHELNKHDVLTVDGYEIMT